MIITRCTKLTHIIAGIRSFYSISYCIITSMNYYPSLQTLQFENESFFSTKRLEISSIVYIFYFIVDLPKLQSLHFMNDCFNMVEMITVTSIHYYYHSQSIFLY